MIWARLGRHQGRRPGVAGAAVYFCAATVLLAGCSAGEQASAGRSAPVTGTSQAGPGAWRTENSGPARRLRDRRGRARQRPGPAYDAAQVEVSMAAQSGTTTLAAAYAYAAWLPSRTAGGCLADAVTVNGVQQPLLWDPGSGLASMARKLLGPALK